MRTPNGLDSIIGSAETLWIPVAFDHGEDVDGIWRSNTCFGAPTADQLDAWRAARRLCDELDGIGFTVRRADPVAGRRA
ncbi:hypothetical protein [Paraburkholderia tropica]|uniref:hypothetical protein n=1 Tax=Paraburkholderia tropica TaxID=92647 RepID=UPI002AB77456|nr:hypothetical protein [Paraburkholderia tropica]